MQISFALITATLSTILSSTAVNCVVAASAAPVKGVAAGTSYEEILSDRASLFIDSNLPPPIPISPVPIDVANIDAPADSVLDKRATGSASAAILLPAYLYPSSWTSPPAWQPLYDAIKQYPGVIFHIVINPHSGPGGAKPDADYAIAISTLRQFPNVVLLGYVHTSWGARSTDLVYADVDTYASWKALGFPMDGIFFDEAPTAPTDALISYMANVTCRAKTVITSTLYGGQAMIYFNPGTVPDLRYYTIADFISIFEDTYDKYLVNEATFAPGTALPLARSNFMVHSMSSGWTQAQVTSFVHSLANGKGLGSVYLTSSRDLSNPYGSFSDDWDEFVAGVDALRG